jgi:predicted lipoprotein with Yx(FWY)xxD motif
MTRTRSITFLAGAAVVLLAVLALVGCGGGGASAQAAPPKTASGQPATLGVANSGLGKILVDSQGRTLYLFQKDVGTTSMCSGACASNWPPLRANGKATVGSGVNASLLGTTSRSDGSAQVTYNGHPLYLFAGDEKPGDTEGQGVDAFGAKWYVVSPAGNLISGTGANSGGGIGY